MQDTGSEYRAYGAKDRAEGKEPNQRIMEGLWWRHYLAGYRDGGGQPQISQRSWQAAGRG